MSYEPAGGLISYFQGKGWSADEASIESTVDTPDLLRLWSSMIVNLRSAQGTYATYGLLHRGMQLPRFKGTQLSEIRASWAVIGKEVFKALKGRPELQDRLLRDEATYLRDMADFTVWRSNILDTVRYSSPGAEGGKYVSFPEAARFYDIVSRYVRDLNQVLWAIPNIESEYERWLSVLPIGARQLFQMGWYTAKNVTPVIKQAVDVTAKAVKGSLTIAEFLIKWGPALAVAGIAGYAVWKYRDRF